MKKLGYAMKLPQFFKSESRDIASLATWYTQAPGQARYGIIDASVLAGKMHRINNQKAPKRIAAYAQYTLLIDRFVSKTRPAANEELWPVAA